MNEKVRLQLEIIDCYAGCPAMLQEVVCPLTDRHLDLYEGEGRWTIREYVHHVVDGDDIWKAFIKRALGNPDGVFDMTWYTQVHDQEHWSDAWGYQQRAIAPSLALFSANRAHIAQLLRLDPGALEKRLAVCMHAGREEMASVQDIVEMQTRHIEGHIEDIRRILENHRV